MPLQKWQLVPRRLRDYFSQALYGHPSSQHYSNMSINVPRPFPKMGTLLDLQNGYIHLKDPKRVHCCTSGKQAENGYITRLLGKKREQ